MNKQVRKVLIEIARKRNGYIHYQELSDRCQLGFHLQEYPQERLEIGYILGDISEHEHIHNRPLLSALVITTSGEEGGGFFRLCESLGFGNASKLKNDPTFAAIQMNLCYEFWQNDDNYNKYKGE